MNRQEEILKKLIEKTESGKYTWKYVSDTTAFEFEYGYGLNLWPILLLVRDSSRRKYKYLQVRFLGMTIAFEGLENLTNTLWDAIVSAEDKKEKDSKDTLLDILWKKVCK